MRQHNTMKIIVSLIVLSIGYLFLLSNQANGQQVWSATYGGANNDWANAIQQTTDGGYIVAGTTKSYGGGNSDFWVLKLDSTGAIIWQKAYGGTENEQAYAIQQTSEGGYIAAGNVTPTGLGYSDIWVVKLNATGGITWQKTYGGSYRDEFYSLQQTNDSGYILAGITESFGAGGMDIFVIKLNADGTVAWQKTYGGTGSDAAKYIRQTSDNGYIIAGETSSFGAVNGDGWIIKLDSTGTIQWQKTYGSSSVDNTSAIQQTSDGYIAVGETYSYGAGQNDFWIIKLNTNGTIAWQKTYGDTWVDRPYIIRQTNDSGFIAAGDISPFGGLNLDLWVVKIDSSGTVTWQKSFGGADFDNAYAVWQTSDGGYVLAGSTQSFGAGGADVWVLKLNSSGNLDPLCTLLTDNNATTGTSTATTADTTATTATSTAATTTTTLSSIDSTASRTIQCPTFTTLLSHKPTIDDSGSSTPNGIIEEDENIALHGILENTGPTNASSVSGLLTTTSPIVINEDSASYPDIAPGATQNCTSPYSITAPANNRPSTHWDISVTESPSCSECQPSSFDFIYHVGNSFDDVAVSNSFYSFIETLIHSGVTSGCTATNYCPAANVVRQQMAKFICAAMSAKTPGSCTTAACAQLFSDVPASNVFCTYIEALYNAGIVSGCQASPLLYCPSGLTKREAMAKFICLAMEHATSGSCPTTACAGTFGDVPASNPFCTYIEAVYNAGVVSGCQASPLLYCPSNTVTRAQMAKFIVNAFDFSL